MSKNDITGDTIITKPASKEYEIGWDRVFNPQIPQEAPESPIVNLSTLDKQSYYPEETNQL